MNDQIELRQLKIKYSELYRDIQLRLEKDGISSEKKLYIITEVIREKLRFFLQKEYSVFNDDNWREELKNLIEADIDERMIKVIKDFYKDIIHNGVEIETKQNYYEDKFLNLSRIVLFGATTILISKFFRYKSKQYEELKLLKLLYDEIIEKQRDVLNIKTIDLFGFKHKYPRYFKSIKDEFDNVLMEWLEKASLKNELRVISDEIFADIIGEIIERLKYDKFLKDTVQIFEEYPKNVKEVDDKVIEALRDVQRQWVIRDSYSPYFKLLKFALADWSGDRANFNNEVKEMKQKNQRNFLREGDPSFENNKRIYFLINKEKLKPKEAFKQLEDETNIDRENLKSGYYSFLKTHTEDIEEWKNEIQ